MSTMAALHVGCRKNSTDDCGIGNFEQKLILSDNTVIRHFHIDFEFFGLMFSTGWYDTKLLMV